MPLSAATQQLEIAVRDLASVGCRLYAVNDDACGPILKGGSMHRTSWLPSSALQLSPVISLVQCSLINARRIACLRAAYIRDQCIAEAGACSLATAEHHAAEGNQSLGLLRAARGALPGEPAP